MAPVAHIMALCSVFNRREITRKSIAALLSQSVPAGVELSVVVVDDGSTDGTSQMLATYFPSVRVVSTGGGYYWAGAMVYGFQNAWDPEAFTHLLVFNDDIVIEQHALMRLLDISLACDKTQVPCVVVGALTDSISGRPTYGGLCRLRWRPKIYFSPVELSECEKSVDTLNMNFALINAASISSFGFLDPAFVHGYADFDYGLRVTDHGGSVIQAPGFIGHCSRNKVDGTWLDFRLPFRERWRLMLGAKGLPPRERLYYLRKHVPIVWLPVFLYPYAKMPFQHLWKAAVRWVVNFFS